MMLYPNPVIDVLLFENSFVGEIAIIDITGNMIYQSTLNSNKLDVSSFATGVY